MNKKQMALIAARLSDLTAHLFALACEQETGELLKTRKIQILAVLDAIRALVLGCPQI